MLADILAEVRHACYASLCGFKDTVPMATGCWMCCSGTSELANDASVYSYLEALGSGTKAQSGPEMH